MMSRYEQFSYAISGIYRCIQKIERDEMIRYGYKGSFAQYLAALIRYPEGLTSVRLGEICDKDKAAVSRAVSEMIEKHLVYRKSVNEADNHYRALLLLTEEGKKAAQYVCTRAQAAVDAVGKDLSDADRAIFYAALAQIAGNLDAIMKKGFPQE